MQEMQKKVCSDMKYIGAYIYNIVIFACLTLIIILAYNFNHHLSVLWIYALMIVFSESKD